MGGRFFSTQVTDVDADGLPDGLEDATNGLKDPPMVAYPTGLPLPNLKEMGAGSGRKDLLMK